MIITCKRQIPARWIIFAAVPWAALTFNTSVMGYAFLFSLKKFVENPAGLTFVISLPGFISIMSSPIVNFLSDRVWTRYGRRKPFIVSSWMGLPACLALMPLMPNFWLLLGVYVLYGLFSDLGSPIEPLSQEIIPPPQRGEGAGAMAW